MEGKVPTQLLNKKLNASTTTGEIELIWREIKKF